jgi:hypothetical protein
MPIQAGTQAGAIVGYLPTFCTRSMLRGERTGSSISFEGLGKSIHVWVAYRGAKTLYDIEPPVGLLPGDTRRLSTVNGRMRTRRFRDVAPSLLGRLPSSTPPTGRAFAGGPALHDLPFPPGLDPRRPSFSGRQSSSSTGKAGVSTNGSSPRSRCSTRS